MRQIRESGNRYVYEFAWLSHQRGAKESGTSHATFQACDFLRLFAFPGKLGTEVDHMKAAVRHQLDPTIRSTDTRDFQGSLRAKIVGQEEGVQALVDLYQVFCAGLNSPGRPVGNLLFLGPTGSARRALWKRPRRSCFKTRAQ